MDADRPRRTLLYVPASNQRALEKAGTLPADMLLLDLEDAVAPETKEQARVAAVAAVSRGFGGREMGIRVNGLGSPWAEADFAAAAGSAADFLAVPKIEDADDARAAVRLAGGKPVLVMQETPKAVLRAEQIAEVPGIHGFIAGFNDLAKDLRARPGAGRLPLLHAAGRILLAARAAGILAFDGVFTSIGDLQGLEAEARQGLEMGFDGKSCIHPDQLAVVNAVFSPSANELADAHGLTGAYAKAVAAGQGVAIWQGRMIEALHVQAAQRLLGMASRIAELDKGGSNKS